VHATARIAKGTRRQVGDVPLLAGVSAPRENDSLRAGDLDWLEVRDAVTRFLAV
jgi:hypothetical protein